MSHLQFQGWFTSKYTPHGIVYTTPLALYSILKNNLTPSEFLRPFFDFKTTPIPIPIYISPSSKSKKNTTTNPNDNTKHLRGFKIDLYDADKYAKIPENKCEIIIKEMLSSVEYMPNWTMYNFHLTKRSIEPIISQLQHNAFPYYDELENLHIELSKFDETNMFQQPLINIYVCSVHDKVNCIMEIEREQRPLLIRERVYEDKITTLIILLNDNCDGRLSFTKEKCDTIVNKFKHQYDYSYTICIDINTNANGDNNEDIWEDYIHKVDLYDEYYTHNINVIRNDKMFKRGQYISKNEITTVRDVIREFVINHNIPKIFEYMKTTEIFLNKNKSSLLSFLHKDDMSLIPELHIRRLSQRERKAFTLAILHFYFQNYSNTCHIIKHYINYEQLKDKSTRYVVSLQYLYMLAKYLKPSKNNKMNLGHIYDISYKNSTQMQTYSILIVLSKLFEHKYTYDTLSRILARSAKQITLNYIAPFIQEKSAYYNLLNLEEPNIYSFISSQLLACIMFVNNEYNTNDIPHYTLNALGSLFKLITTSHENAFYNCKEFYYSNMVRYSHVVKQYETAIEFCKICIRLIMNRENKNYGLLTEMVGMFCNSVKNYKGFSDGVNEFVDFDIPVLYRESVVVVEEEDYEFWNRLKGCGSGNGVGDYERYSIVLSKKKYCILTKNDRMILDYLQNGILCYNKDKLTGSHRRNKFNIRSGRFVYVRFSICNPLLIPINVTSLQLNITNNESNNNSNEMVASSEVIESLILNPNSTMEMLLKCNAISQEGVFTINGIKMTINNSINLKLNFTYTRDNDTLYTKHKAMNKLNLIANHAQRDLLLQFTIINRNKYIDISFPKGKDISVFTNELSFIPVVITNKLSEEIKKVTLYVSETSTKIKNICLCDYYYEDIEYDKPKLFFIPIYCEKIGTYCISLLTKFEETYTYKDYEINRHLITITCKQGHLFSMRHSISSFDCINDTITFGFNLISEYSNESNSAHLNTITIPITEIPNTSLTTNQIKVINQSINNKQLITTSQYISYISKQISLSTYKEQTIRNYITKIAKAIYTNYSSSQNNFSFQNQSNLISTICNFILKIITYSVIIPYEHIDINTNNIIYSFTYYKHEINSLEINTNYIKKTFLEHVTTNASSLCSLNGGNNQVIQITISFHNTNVVFSTFINQIHFEVNVNQCKGMFTCIGNSKHVINIHSTSSQIIPCVFNVIITNNTDYVDLNIINARILFNEDIPLKTCLIKNIPLILPYKI